MKNKFKTAITGVVTAVTLLATMFTSFGVLGQTVNGGGYYTPARVINSASTTSTNTFWGPTTNSTGWPIAVLGGLVVTNYTKVDSGPGKDTAFQFTTTPNVAVGTTGGQQVVWTIYRNVQAGSPTNNIGSNLNIEKVCTVTNLYSSSTSTAAVTTCTNLGAANGLDGAITTFYIASLDASAMTNGILITNYSVWVNNQ